MAFKKTLLQPAVVNWLVHPLSLFFTRQMMFVISTAALASQLFFYFYMLPKLNIDLSQINSVELVKAIALVALGLLVHELGHAAAAYRMGCRQVEIGVGWYLYFIVFFADLSESWRLQRHQRAIIDAAGMYFQAGFIAILTAWLYSSPSSAVLSAILLLNISLLWNLNPFLRLDGYWLASDLLGITNLRQQTAQLISRLLSPNRHGYQSQANNDLPPRSAFYLLIYAISSNLFFLWLLYYISTELIIGVLQQIPISFKELIALFDTSFIFSDWLVVITTLLWQCLLLYFCVYLITQTIRKMLRWLVQRKK